MSSRRSLLNKWSREIHRWGTVVVVLPLLLVIVTGVLLLLKDNTDWVQPPTAKVLNQQLSIGWDELLRSAASVDEAQVETWDDVDRIDVRPSKGIAKIRSKNRWEVQVDTSTGEVVHVAYRRSDLIESLHDGSFFSDWVKLGIYLPSALVLLVLWLTGIWLWFMPHLAKRRRKRSVV
jgi:uncharacterized iron-regulated membrane protein